LTCGVTIKALYSIEASKMQIKRLLDDREVFVGDRVFDAEGRFYEFVEQSGSELISRSVIIWSQPRQYIR
jgi:hypothetical protein